MSAMGRNQEQVVHPKRDADAASRVQGRRAAVALGCQQKFNQLAEIAFPINAKARADWLDHRAGFVHVVVGLLRPG